MSDLDLGPATVDLKGITAGDRNETDLIFENEGAPWNLTGAILTAQARDTKHALIATLTTTITPVDAAAGLFEMAWPGDDVRTVLDSLGLDRWVGWWDLQILEAGQTEPVTMLEGRIEVRMDVTR